MAQESKSRAVFEEAVLPSGDARSELETLRESEKRFRVLTELTNDYGYVVHAEGDELLCDWLTGGVERITGLTNEELEQRGLWHLVHPGDRDAVRTGLSRVLKGDSLVHEFRIGFPVAVDRHEHGDPLPLTMQGFAMRGTPTLVLIDGAGLIREHFFGQVDDLAVGVAIGRLLAERS